MSEEGTGPGPPVCGHVGGEVHGDSKGSFRGQALLGKGSSSTLTSADPGKTGNAPSMVWAQKVSITHHIIVSENRPLGVGWWNMSFPFQKATYIDSK